MAKKKRRVNFEKATIRADSFDKCIALFQKIQRALKKEKNPRNKQILLAYAANVLKKALYRFSGSSYLKCVQICFLICLFEETRPLPSYYNKLFKEALKKANTRRARRHRENQKKKEARANQRKKAGVKA